MIDYYGIWSVCILHIDAEGAYFEILSSWTLKTLKPRLVLFKCTHLDSHQINSLLKEPSDEGYKYHKLKKDMLAIHNSKGCAPLN